MTPVTSPRRWTIFVSSLNLNRRVRERDHPVEVGVGLLSPAELAQQRALHTEEVFKVATSAAPGRRDRGDVDLLHPHHRIKRAFCFIAANG